MTTSSNNAARRLIDRLPRKALVRLSGRDANERTNGELRRRLVYELDLDLPLLLNLAVRDELDAMASYAALEGTAELSIGELRARLWAWGAALEAGDAGLLGTDVQPVPVVLRGKLVHMGAGAGVAPITREVPRPIPPPVTIAAVVREPETLEELLDNAQGLVGVRLGPATRDKGAFGARIAALLGVVEHNAAEPDWRGEVEIKTVPVVRDPSGFWRVKEDPAVSMEGVEPMTKLLRVLWIARVADAADSPVLSWYYQECDDTTRRLAERDLHTRPKGGAGATTRGWYMHKRFFADSGFLRTLNG